ncbi:MAG: hypothetical protein HY421_02785 [Candidatus Kerfeldbacteria bacterium]|nr:hypothetical protein [Candidatus Kerfeldbacteria bacterium]
MTTDSFSFLALIPAILVGFVLTILVTLFLVAPVTIGATVLYVFWRSGDRDVRRCSGQPS